MKIALDMSPLKSGRYLQHRVRGTGFYLQNLEASLEKYYPENKYICFNKGNLLKGDIDVVHYPYFEPFFLTLPFFNKYKTVVTVHDLIPFVFAKEFPSGLKGKFKWQIQKFALRNTSQIITDSESSKRDIIKFAGISKDKINVVYLAASSEFKVIHPSASSGSGFRIQNLQKKYNLPERFILYVGDVTWNKNLPRLIQAIKKVKVPLVMVGSALVDRDVDLSNPWNKDFNKVLELIDRDKSIIRLGFVSEEELVLLYNIATVFVMPSIYEGFGLPVLEAMSCGCPVVTSKGGSLAEVVGTSGKYVDPNDIDSIAKGISQVFNNPTLQKELSQKGIIQAKKFTWEKTAKETMNVYKQVKTLE